MKIRLLLVGPLPPPIHGVAILQETLANSVLRERFDLSVFDMADRSKDALKTISHFSIQNAIIGMWHCVKIFFRMLLNRPHVVHLFLSQSRWGFFRDAVIIRMAGIFGARVVANLNGSYFREFYEKSPSGRQRRIKGVLNRISIIQVLGERLRGIFEGLVPPERISVVPNGIHHDQYQQIAEKRRGRKSGRSILFMGALNYEKGVVELIEAFDAIAGEFPDSRLRIAGAWFEESHKLKILDAYEKSQHKDRIEFLGVVRGESKNRALAESDVFVLATYYHIEGQPVAILEAMACGLPVISCDKGAVADMVADGMGGYIIEPRSSLALADALRKLFSNPEKMEQMGTFNHHRFIEKYTVSSYIDTVAKDIERAKACE